MASRVHSTTGTVCRSTYLGLCLIVTLGTACAFDASKLRAQASDAQAWPVDYPSALEARATADNDSHAADLDGAGGSTGIGGNDAGTGDVPVRIDVSDGSTEADVARSPDSSAVAEGADAIDLPVATGPDAPMGRDGRAEADVTETIDLGGSSGAGGIGGTTGTGTGGTISTGGIGGTVGAGGAESGGAGGVGGAGGSATLDGSVASGAGGSGASAGTGGSGGTPVTYYRLIPQSRTTSSLEVLDGATTNGTQVQMAPTSASDKQAFALLDAGNGNVRIAMKANSAKCLGLMGNGTTNNTLLEVQDCNDTNYQAFTEISNSGKPGFWFKNVRAGRCIDVKGGGLTNGALVQILDCNTYATSYNQYLQPQAM